VVQPGEGALDDPAGAAEAGAMHDLSAGATAIGTPLSLTTDADGFVVGLRVPTGRVEQTVLGQRRRLRSRSKGKHGKKRCARLGR
jgi:hypothetical protein